MLIVCISAAAMVVDALQAPMKASHTSTPTIVQAPPPQGFTWSTVVTGMTGSVVPTAILKQPEPSAKSVVQPTRKEKVIQPFLSKPVSDPAEPVNIALRLPLTKPKMHLLATLNVFTSIFAGVALAAGTAVQRAPLVCAFAVWLLYGASASMGAALDMLGAGLKVAWRLSPVFVAVPMIFRDSGNAVGVRDFN